MEPSQEETGSSSGVSRPNLLSGSGNSGSHSSSVNLLGAVESGNDSKPGIPFDTSTPSSNRKSFFWIAGIGVLIGGSALVWALRNEPADAREPMIAMAHSSAPRSTPEPAASTPAADSGAQASEAASASSALSSHDEPSALNSEHGAARVEQMSSTDTGQVMATAAPPDMQASSSPLATTTAAALAAGSMAERTPHGKGEGHTDSTMKKAKALEHTSADRSASAKSGSSKAAPAKVTASAPGQRSTQVAQKSARKTPAKNKKGNSEDADADVVAAIMAGLDDDESGSGKPNGRSSKKSTTSGNGPSSIAELVNRCNGLPTAKELACRRRICDGYWGKAQACPASMAP
jgi:hypothetical protein